MSVRDLFSNAIESSSVHLLVVNGASRSRVVFVVPSALHGSEGTDIRRTRQRPSR